MIEVMIASFALSSSLLYLAWAKVRVQFLRQSLYEIRGELWDTARTLGRLDDPAYCKAREHLNSMIRLCGLYSVTTFRIVERHARALPAPEHPSSTSKAMQTAIDKARNASTDRIINHVMFCRASGWFYLCTLLFRKSIESWWQALRDVGQTIRGILESPFVDRLAPFEKHRR